MTGPIYTGGNGTGIYSSPIKPVTWDTKPATGAVGDQIYVSDIGEYGAVYTWNGAAWTHPGQIEIFQRAKGWVVPSLAAANAATYSQTGTTITVTSTGHNIPATNYDTKDVYLNMGTTATGETIPPGWFSNFQRTGVNTFTCVSTVSQTGTGAVNTNLAEVAIVDIADSIQGTSMGLNGKLLFSYLSSNNNSAGTKTARFKIDAVTLEYVNTTATISDLGTDPVTISNRNSFTSQVLGYNGVSTVLAIDTSIDFAVGFYTQLSAANDYIAIHAASVYISPS